MIKADAPAKVKRTHGALATLWPLLLSIGLVTFVNLPSSRADVSEKEVQTIEQQEFGIESNKAERKQQEKPANPERPPEDYQPQAEPEKVKPIEAEEFRVKLVKKSHSGKVLLFEDLTDNRPRPGKILLLKKDNDDIAAVRVLKNLPGKFAAKITLPINDLKPDTEYRAIKKLGDKMIARIKEREKRGKDLESAKTDEDLAKEVNPDDNELDRGIPTPKKKTKKVIDKPGGAPGSNDTTLDTPAAPSADKKPEALFTKDGQELPDSESIEIKDEDEAAADVTVQEDLPIEAHRSALSLEYGSMKSVDSGGNAASYNGIGLRYGFNAWRMAFFNRKSFQDMVTFELGLFYYTISSFASVGDEVSVIPIIGTLRYSLLFGESLSAFFYFGFVKNDASSSTPGTNVSVLNTTKGAVGVGAMFKLGPQWAVRVDVGTDLFGIGAVLKF